MKMRLGAKQEMFPGYKNKNEGMSFDQAHPVSQAEIKATSIPAFHEHIVGGRAVLWPEGGAEVAQIQNQGNEKMSERL